MIVRVNSGSELGRSGVFSTHARLSKLTQWNPSVHQATAGLFRIEQQIKERR
jgi:hypothetical protein